MQNYGVGKVEAINNGDTILIKVGEIYFETTEDGEVKGEVEVILDDTPGEIEGQGTVDEPFVIMSIEDLVVFSKRVNEGATYGGKYIELGKTLDFNSNLSYVNPNTTEYDIYLGGDGTKSLKEQLTNGLGFIPIGQNQSKYFRGDFNGKNNEIKNIKIDVEEFGGVFGAITGYVKIRNVSVTGNIKSAKSAGGIVGCVNDQHDTPFISNCTNYATICATNAGGILGHHGGVGTGIATISSCVNYGKVIGNPNAGGILGSGELATTNIKGCVNYSEVVGQNVGGMIGRAYNTNIISCCVMPSSEVRTPLDVGNAGGMVGFSYLVSKLYNSINNGSVTAGENVRTDLLEKVIITMIHG